MNTYRIETITPTNGKAFDRVVSTNAVGEDRTSWTVRDDKVDEQSLSYSGGTSWNRDSLIQNYDGNAELTELLVELIRRADEAGL